MEVRPKRPTMWLHVTHRLKEQSVVFGEVNVNEQRKMILFSSA